MLCVETGTSDEIRVCPGWPKATVTASDSTRCVPPASRSLWCKKSKSECSKVKMLGKHLSQECSAHMHGTTSNGNNVNKSRQANKCFCWVFTPIWGLMVQSSHQYGALKIFNYVLHVLLHVIWAGLRMICLILCRQNKEGRFYICISIGPDKEGSVWTVLCSQDKEGKFCTVACSLAKSPTVLSGYQWGRISLNWTDCCKIWDSFIHMLKIWLWKPLALKGA